MTLVRAAKGLAQRAGRGAQETRLQVLQECTGESRDLQKRCLKIRLNPHHRYYSEMSDAQYSPYRKFNKSGNEEGFQDGPPSWNPSWQKVIYNIGTELLMLTSNLHNSTLRDRTKMILCAPESSDRDLSSQLGPRAAAAIF